MHHYRNNIVESRKKSVSDSHIRVNDGQIVSSTRKLMYGGNWLTALKFIAPVVLPFAVDAARKKIGIGFQKDTGIIQKTKQQENKPISKEDILHEISMTFSNKPKRKVGRGLRVIT